jgi:hypothetical protein
METDASNIGIGAVLLQEHELLRPVAFASRKLTTTEQAYSTSEREMLGIVYGYEQFYSLIYGRKIKIFTDHKPLVTAKKLKKPNGRLGRLYHKLQDVDYELFYKEGSENHLPDLLSREFETEANETAINSTINWTLV